ncbi:MAG TPA: hypothetical protein VF288_02430 [Mycobacteriales bacterium]
MAAGDPSTPASPTPAPQRPVVRRRAPAISAGVQGALLALCGVRSGATVLDLTPGGCFVRPAHAAAGKGGVVLVAQPAALAESLPAVLRGAQVTHVFALLPGSRLLTVLRPVLRAGARVAMTAVDADAVHEAALVAAYDVVHLEPDVEGMVGAVVRPRPPS